MTTRHAYLDGNNNTYEIGDRLVYIPITPAQSSSGMYSGGEPKSVALDAEHRAAILELFDRIEADRDNVIETRPKGCGTVIRGEHTTFVRSDSSLKLELERLLKSLL
jgi:hypothetical protein